MRIIIHVDDVISMTGKGQDAAERLLKKVRTHFRKSKRTPVTINEFCSYTGIDRELVLPFLKT